jgi:hypothetical protein
MRILLAVTLIISVWAGGKTQTTPQKFFDRIPALPNDPCSMTTKSRVAYQQQITTLIVDVQKMVATLQQEQEQQAEEDTKLIRENLAKEAGATPDMITRLQKGEEMSHEEAMKLASELLETKMNVSMEELNNLENLSETGQEAWAEAYGTEKMAEAQNQSGSSVDAQKKANTLAGMIQDQTQLTQRLMAEENRIQELFTELDQDTTGQKLLENIRGWKAKHSSMGGVDYGQGPEMDALAGKIRAAEMSYCLLRTPEYFSLLSEYRDTIAKTLPEYMRLEQLTRETNRLHTGVSNHGTPGLTCYQLILDYLYKHEALFQFCSEPFGE